MKEINIKTKFKKGSLYYIKFLDHFKGSDDSVSCEVVGWAIKETKTAVAISFWNTDYEEGKIEDKYEPCAIVKSTITEKILISFK